MGEALRTFLPSKYIFLRSQKSCISTASRLSSKSSHANHLPWDAKKKGPKAGPLGTEVDGIFQGKKVELFLSFSVREYSFKAFDFDGVNKQRIMFFPANFKEGPPFFLVDNNYLQWANAQFLLS